MVTELGERIRTLNGSLSCVELVRRFAPSVQLEKHTGRGESVKEWCSPCPKCGGHDRFYVSESYAACRQCHTARMDAVGLTAWLLDVSQGEAAERLGNGVSVSVSRDTDTRKNGDTRRDTQIDTAWQRDAEEHVQRAHERLLSAAGRDARRYLASRGFTPDTWRKFQLGFVPSVRVPRSEERAGAISWPIVGESHGDGVVAVKYRFVSPTTSGSRYTMRAGSNVTGRLFGVNGLPEWVTPWDEPATSTVERLACLVLCEGELNGVAVAQACEPFGVAVLSTGSESQNRLPWWAVSLASRFGCVVTWFDKPDVSTSVLAQFHAVNRHAVAVRSPTVDGVKLDANEMLNRGLLPAFVLGARLRATPDERLESVLWRACDVAGDVGVDVETARAVTRLADRVGRRVQLAERDGRWWWQPSQNGV